MLGVVVVCDDNSDCYSATWPQSWADAIMRMARAKFVNYRAATGARSPRLIINFDDIQVDDNPMIMTLSQTYWHSPTLSESG